MKTGISNMAHGRRNGFSLIELIIVIIVISILVSISAVGVNIYIKDARDNERATKVSILVEALEKYYDQNGEYPSCSIVRDNPATAAAALGGIDEDLFRTPTAESPSGLVCNSGSSFPSESNDTFMYESPYGTPSDPNVARTQYEILYWNEDKKQVDGEYSRRGW